MWGLFRVVKMAAVAYAAWRAVRPARPAGSPPTRGDLMAVGKQALDRAIRQARTGLAGGRA